MANYQQPGWAPTNYQPGNNHTSCPVCSAPARNGLGTVRFDWICQNGHQFEFGVCNGATISIGNYAFVSGPYVIRKPGPETGF